MIAEKNNIPMELKDEALEAVSGGSDKSRRDRRHPGPWYTPEEMWAQGYIVLGDPNRPITEYNNHRVFAERNPKRCPFCWRNDHWYDEGMDRYYCGACLKQFYMYYE